MTIKDLTYYSICNTIWSELDNKCARIIDINVAPVVKENVRNVFQPAVLDSVKEILTQIK